MANNLRTFGSPHRYVQGPGALAALPRWLERLGGKAVIVSDEETWNLLGVRVGEHFPASSLPAPVTFSGDVTGETIQRVVARCRDHSPDLIVGLGGGKSLDVGKAVAIALGIRVITVPTIASNDSPTSRSYALYDDNHVLQAVERGERNPELVLVDTAIIARTPARFLRAGIGDALAKKFEGEAMDNAGGLTSHGSRPLRTGLVIADGCYRTIRDYAVGGIRANVAGQPDEAFERTVEACILMSGLGFENSGLSVAHSMTRGLMATSATAGALHGEHVAYGLLVQLYTEGRREAFIDDMLQFYDDVGLPRRLADLGMMSPGDEQFAFIAERTLVAPHMGNVPKPVNGEMLVEAMHCLESR